MGRNTSIILGEHFDDFIRDQIQEGSYQTVSEVVRSALRLLETEQQKIKAIQTALVVGEESGDPRPFDNEAFKARMKAKLLSND
jgi:antitoxin ParD1/3/4